MKRTILTLILSTLLIPTVLAGSVIIDYSSTYTVPKIVGPNDSFVLYLKFVNKNTQAYITDMEVKLNLPECFESKQKEFNIKEIAPGSYYVLPVNLKAKDCKYSIYNLEIDLKYYEGGNLKEDKTYVPIVITEIPKIEIIKTTLEPIRDDIYNLKIGIKNLGNINVKDLKLILNQSSCANTIYSNSYVIGELKAGEEKDIEIPIKILNYDEKLCSFYATLVYSDWLGNQYSELSLISFLLPSKEIDVEVKLMKINNKNNELEFAIINSGEVDIKGAYIEILKYSGFDTTDKLIYIGDIDSNDYDTFGLPIIPENKTLTVKLALHYTVNNEEYTKVYEFKINYPYERKIRYEYAAFIVLIAILLYSVLKRRKNEAI